MRLFRRTLLCLVVGVTALIAIYFIQRRPDRRSLQSTGGTIENVQALFGGKEALEVIIAPDSVAASRIAQPKADRPAEVRLKDYQVVAGPVGVPAEIVRELQPALSSPDSYGW